MKKILLATMTIIPIIVNAAPWQNRIDTGATLELEWAHATEQGSSQKRELVFKPDMTIELPNAQFNVEGRLRHDTVGDIDQDKTQFHLREFTLETTLGRTFLTLGKQQIAWGEADGLKVLDVVNPQEWREFILDDFDDSRIPLWTLNAEIPVGESTLQLIAILEQQYHERAKAGERYFFTSPLVVPAPPPGIPVIVNATQMTKGVFKNADVGFRLSGFSSGWDYSINYLYHYDDNAVLFRELQLSSSGSQIIIRPEYKRNHLMGGTLSNAFGDFTLRSEIGYSLGRYYATNNSSDRDGVVQSNEFSYVFGLDWFGLSDTFISAQLFQSYLTKREPGMLRDRMNTTITFLMERDYLNDTLKMRLLWLHSVDNDDGLLRPKISYQYNDMTALWLGLDIFYGSEEGLFGQFDQQDRVLVGIEVGI